MSNPTCPLHGCCNDSEAIKDLLSNHGNGDPNFSAWKKDNITTKVKKFIVYRSFVQAKEENLLVERTTSIWSNTFGNNHVIARCWPSILT